MNKIALVWACLAFAGLGRQVQVSEADHQRPASLQTLAEAHGSIERRRTGVTGNPLKALATLLVGRNSAAAFNALRPFGNPTPSSPHKSISARRIAAPNMKWDVSLAPWVVEYGKQEPPVKLPEGVEMGQGPVPFTITDEHRQRLEEDGVVHIPGLLKSDWIQYLRDTTDWQVNNPHVWSALGVASGLYDYSQRSVWASNDGFANFLYHSPLASALAGLSKAEELRLSTDLLMVNPNKGFQWHQDNQNGPIDAFADGVALRWWVTMDDCPPDHGAPVYLKGSHRNTGVSSDAVYVDLAKDDLLKYPELLEFRPKAGDLIVWHAKAIHKIDGPKTQDWEASKRRVYGGTVVIDDSKYVAGMQFSDMGSHNLEDGDPLKGPLFPKIYPISDPVERKVRASGKCTRTWEGFQRLTSNMASSIGEMGSWMKVLNDDDKKQPTRR